MSGRRVHLASWPHLPRYLQSAQSRRQRRRNREDLIQRDDDKEETVKKRLAVYHEQTGSAGRFTASWKANTRRNTSLLTALSRRSRESRSIGRIGKINRKGQFEKQEIRFSEREACRGYDLFLINNAIDNNGCAYGQNRNENTMNPLITDFQTPQQRTPSSLPLILPTVHTLGFVRNLDPALCQIKIGKELFTATGAVWRKA